MIYNIVLAAHVFVCFVLIVVVLMQSSKGGGLAGAFGGGGGETLFGGQETASILSRSTTYLAIGFMALSVVLAFMASHRGSARAPSAIRQSIQTQGNVIPTGQSIDQILAAPDTTVTDSDPSQ